jgi:hypothetical protein
VNLARNSSHLTGDNRDTAEAWEWLRENDIRSSHLSTDSRYVIAFTVVVEVSR